MPGKRQKKPAPAPEPEDESDPLDAMTDVELAAYVAANPYAHLTHALIRKLFKIGQHEMRKVVKLKPPTVSGKINPALFQKWLWMKREVVGRA